MYPQSMFWATLKNIKFFLMKFSILTTKENLLILYGPVFVMVIQMSRRQKQKVRNDGKCTWKNCKFSGNSLNG